MNPGHHLDTEFILRRIAETFPDWAVGLPVLFAFLVLFVVACFRREGGTGGLFWGLCLFFVVPLTLASRPEALTGDYFQDVALPNGLNVLGGLVLGGFLLHLVLDFFRARLAFWQLLIVPAVAAGYVAYLHVARELPLQARLAPVFALFLLHVVLLAWRTGMVWALVVLSVLSAVYVPLALMFKPVFSWWVVLGPTVLAALFYVGMMYVKDAQSIHPAWAAFLGLLRCTVYAILAFVFLLPGCQTFETTEIFPKVLVLFDVSGSMKTKDDPLEPGQKRDTLLTRQDKVFAFWNSGVGPDKKPRTSFEERLLDKSPVNAYRFGSIADETTIVALEKDQPKDKRWDAEQWKRWLNPNKDHIVVPEKLSAEEQLKYRARVQDLYDSLVSGTNVGGSALQVAKAEAASFLQAIIIFSDGQSNLGGSEPVREFLDRVNNPRRKVHVFTVGVGDYRQPAEIRIDDLQAPQIARPDDKFPVRVPVIGSGLRDEEFEVLLDVVRAKDSLGNPLKGEKKFTLGPKRGKFKGAGDNPQDVIEFEIDIQDLKGLKAADDKNHDLEGEWEFVARVPRHVRESFESPEHVTDPPTRVQVQNKELRILLFAGGPTRDYQFIRTLLFREVQEKRMELSVFLQTGGKDEGVDQDVAGDRLLSHFPNRMGQDDPTDKYSSLNMYDVIIAIDPDWTALDANQIKMIEQWVGRDAGGVIFVAGPVNTYALARENDKLLPLKTIYPVLLNDYRFTGLGLGVDTTRPYVLNFPPAAKSLDFLKLEESGTGPTAGWDRFFWGEARKPDAGKDGRPVRGIHNYYPVLNIRPDSTVLATFAGPEATRINDGKDEQPYLVTMRYGNGKTVYIGSGETWRLRQFKETYHERLWIKLARFAASGSQQQKKYGRILLGRKAPTGSIGFEAQIKGSDLMPLPRDGKPLVVMKRRGDIEAKPETFELKAKATQGDWQGWFTGTIKVKEPGEYDFSIPIPNTTESLSHSLEVYKLKLEDANVRENHKELYNLATKADPILNRLSGEARKEIERLLQPVSEDIRDGKEGARLFFPLKHADSITKCLVNLQPHRDRTKGALQDLWDRGEAVALYHFLWSVPLALGLLAFAILMFHERYTWAVVALAVAVALPLGVVGYDRVMEPEWMYLPVDFSFVLVTAVALLSVEWLTRKLLRLA